MSGATTLGRRPMLLAAALLAAGPVASSAPAGAQEWRAEMQGGELRRELSRAATTSRSLMAGLRYLDGPSWIGAYAGIPTQEGDAPWATAIASLRVQTGDGAWGVGADLDGRLFGQRESRTELLDDGAGDGPGGLPGPIRPPATDGDVVPGGWSASVGAMPRISYEGSVFSGALSAGATQYYSAVGEDAFERGLLQGVATASLAPLERLLVTAEGRHYAADEGAYSAVELSAFALPHDRLTVWSSVGRWLDEDVAGTPWSAGLRATLAERVDVTASVDRSTFDPVYLSPPATAWNVGLSVRLSDPTEPPAPVPETYEEGHATVFLPDEDAPERPRVAGDFNDWTPAPMERGADGWRFTVQLEPGVYYYAFVDREGEWFVPESVPGRKDDGFGGHVAVLVVQ